MKKKVMALVLITILASGCAANSNSGKNEVESRVMRSEKNNSEKIENDEIEEYTLEMARDNGDVIGGNMKIENLDRLLEFMDNTEKGKEGNLRITSVTKEGDIIIDDLAYNGEVIELKHDNRRDEFAAEEDRKITTGEYQKIVVKERYNEDYEGTFIEYFLQTDDGEKSFGIAQRFEKKQ